MQENREKVVQDVHAAQAALTKAIGVARDAGYRVSFQTNAGAPTAFVDGGPVAKPEPEKAEPNPTASK